MPSRCTVPIPAFALTLDPSGRQAHWLSQAERHGLDLQLERAVGPAELPAHVPASVLQQLGALRYGRVGTRVGRDAILRCLQLAMQVHCPKVIALSPLPGQIQRVPAHALALRILQQRIHAADSVSKALFQTALRLAANRGLLETAEPGGHDALARGRRDFAAEVADAVRRVDIIVALAAQRRAGFVS